MAVDESVPDLALLQQFLLREGYQVRTARDGEVLDEARRGWRDAALVAELIVLHGERVRDAK